MPNLKLNAEQLAAVATQMTDVMKNMSNIGDIGIAPDFSDAQLRNPMQNEFPLLDYLMNTAAARKMRERMRNGLQGLHKDSDTGKWNAMLPYSIGTKELADTAGECCWIPPDIAKCGGKVELSLLCLKDCEDIMDKLLNNQRFVGSNDLGAPFQNPGESVSAARTRWARMMMAWFTAKNAYLGVLGAETGTIKPFHGLTEVMEDPAVIKVAGTNILGAFASQWCRLSVLGGTDYVFACTPLVYEAINQAVQPGRWNVLPAGWARVGEELRFHGIRFIVDKWLPLDLDAATGEVFLLSGEEAGAWFATTLAPADGFVLENQTTNTNDPAQGCSTQCDLYYNIGAVFNNNPNKAAVITDIPLSANCMGSSLQGLDDLIQPETPIPMV